MSLPQLISPKAFLRGRRPERFSDSVFTKEKKLDRSKLEYHLETLTSRGQETDFERFARKLAEREICPNLLPQTGPRGGGDSKVDSETYPVAENLALAWFIGEDIKSANERWAFAFSTAKKWRPKLKDDVDKLASTGRAYVKAFFVTNQFVKDRTRAQLEDQLSKTYNLDIRILDRNWILERVFSGGHTDIVEDELNLCIQARQVTQKGPLDCERENDLEEIDSRIRTAVQENRFTISLVDDALNAAELSRALDRPKHEVEGRFARADRLALKFGTLRQRVEVAYQKAWTAFWWYEDESAIPDLYMEVEKRARGSRNAYDVERLSSLWYILETCIRHEANQEQILWFGERTKILKSELERLTNEIGRPSTALQAKTLLLNIQLRESQAANKPLEPILKELQKIIEKASSLTGFPVSPIIQMIAELGKYLVAEPGYEELFETAVRISSEQKQNLEAASLLVQRGQQLLDAERPYDAIRKLGCSLRLLFNHAGRYEAVRALYLCGIAYEQVGLLWAARGALVAAASLATDEFWKYNRITRFQSFCYERLKWIELRLGRLPQILIWHETDLACKLALAENEEKLEKLSENDKVFDASLGILLLRTDLPDLRWLKRLPGGLKQLNLLHASVALIYAFGYDNAVSKRLGYSKYQCEEYFVNLSCQPIADDLPATPNLSNQQRVILNSHVLGCEYKVDVANVSPCIEIAESLLAANEALLATVPVTHAFATTPELPISIEKSDSTGWPFSFKVMEIAGSPHVEIQVSHFSPHQLTENEQITLRSEIKKVAVQLVVNSIHFRNFETTMSELSKEGAFDRAINFTSSFVAVGNVLGDNAPKNLTDWERGQSYSIRRSKSWNSEMKEQGRLKNQSTSIKGEVIKHPEIRTVSLIKSGLWDRAGWSGMLFISSQDGSWPPILAPVFESEQTGCEIFEDWLNELGQFDKANKLRVGIIRGIDRDHPHSYRVYFDINHGNISCEKRFHHLINIGRVHRMNPSDSSNLNRFVDDFKRQGKYFLAPGFVDTKTDRVNLGTRLVKQHIEIRNAWEIGRNDHDSFAIEPDDKPIIPVDVENPPINELLAHRQNSESTP